MDIDGFGEKTLQVLFEQNILKKVDDFYLLTKEDLINLEGFQERKIAKLLKSIEDSKKKSLENVIFGLGIPHIGYKTSLDLAKELKTMEKIMTQTLEEFTVMDDFGEVKAQALIKFFANEENKILIENLKNHDVNFNYIKDNFAANLKKESKLYKKIVVITGTFSDFNRVDAEKHLIANGAIVRKSISSKTDFLICGKNPSQNKIKKIEPEKILNTVSLSDML